MEKNGQNEMDSKSFEEEIAHQLGYASHNEYLAFCDVCIDMCRLEEYFATGRKVSKNKRFSRQECISVIEKNQLMDLLNDNKYRSMPDRIRNVFLYYYNCLQIYKRILTYYFIKFRRNARGFDSEGIDENLQNIQKVQFEIQKYSYIVSEQIKRARIRLKDNDLNDFNVLLYDIGFRNGMSQNL